MKKFEQRGVQIVSLREHIDTSTATGQALLSILGAINQMERELKSERTAAGRGSAEGRFFPTLRRSAAYNFSVTLLILSSIVWLRSVRVPALMVVVILGAPIS